MATAPAKKTDEPETEPDSAEQSSTRKPAAELADVSTRLEPDTDVVAMPSRKASGEPDQTEGFAVIGEGGFERSVDDVEAEAERHLGARP